MVTYEYNKRQFRVFSYLLWWSSNRIRELSAPSMSNHYEYLAVGKRTIYLTDVDFWYYPDDCELLVSSSLDENYERKINCRKELSLIVYRVQYNAYIFKFLTFNYKNLKCMS